MIDIHVDSRYKFADSVQQKIDILLRQAGFNPDEWQARILCAKSGSSKSGSIRLAGKGHNNIMVRVKPFVLSEDDHLFNLVPPKEVKIQDAYGKLSLVIDTANRIISRFPERKNEMPLNKTGLQEENHINDAPATLKEQDVPPRIGLGRNEEAPIPGSTLGKHLEELDRKPDVVPPSPQKSHLLISVGADGFKTIRSILDDKNALRYVLAMIRKVEGLGRSNSQDEFKQLLKTACGWEELTDVKVSRLLGEMEKKELINDLTNTRRKKIGYCLTDESEKMLRGYELASVAVSKPQPSVDLGKSLIDFVGRAKGLVELGETLTANRNLRSEAVLRHEYLIDEQKKIQAQIDELDNDYLAICNKCPEASQALAVLNKLLPENVAKGLAETGDKS